MTHYCIQYSLVILFLLFQSAHTQATTHEQSAQKTAVTTPVQDLTELLKILETVKKTHGNKKHAAVAEALENVGHAYTEQHNYRKGLVYHKKALKMLKALYGKKPHMAVANALKNVGFTYSNLDCIYELMYCERALNMYKALHNNQAHVSVANMLSHIGSVYSKVKQTEKALSYKREALGMFQTLYSDGPNVNVANLLFNVGVAYYTTSDFDNALSHLQQSLQMYTLLAKSAPHDRDVADALNYIGLVYFDQKCFQKGITYFKQASDVYKSKNDGFVYLGQAQAVQNIGASYVALKDFSKAIPHLKEALDFYKTLFEGQAKAITLICLSDLGYAHQEINSLSESLSYYEQALAMCKNLYDVGGVSYKSAALIEKIARVYGHMHNRPSQLSYLQEAKKMYINLGEKRAQNMSYSGTTYFFKTDGNVARVQHDIGMAYYLSDNSKKSWQCFQQASKDYKVLYKENKDKKQLIVGNMRALKMMGTIYAGLSKHKKAEQYYKKSFQAARRSKDACHAARTYYDLGRFYHSAMHNGCPEKIKQKYINNAHKAFESAVKMNSEPKADIWTSYANFLIDTQQFSQAYNYLIRSIDSEDYACSLEYFWGDRMTIPHVLQTQVQQEKIVKVSAIDYALYLLLHHYKAFVHAGITPEKPREDYLAIFQQGIATRTVDYLETKKLNSTARLLIDAL